MNDVARLEVVNRGNGVFDVMWDSVSRATHYEVYYTLSNDNCVDYRGRNPTFHSMHYLQTRYTSERITDLPSAYFNAYNHLKNGVLIVWVRAVQGTNPPFVFSDWSDACATNNILDGITKDIPYSEDLSLKQAVGQMLLVGFNGERMDTGITHMIEDIGPGGVVLFDRKNPSNLTSPEQLRVLTTEVQAVSRIPAFVAVDAEGDM